MEAERAEEREVLQSIYEGDANFTQKEDNLFQYKYEDCGENKNFVLEVKWGASYPEEAPEISLDVFYNKHINQSVKTQISEAVSEQAQGMLGMSMTFSLIEWLKDNLKDLLRDQPDHPDVCASATTADKEICAAANNMTISGTGKPESTKTSKKKCDNLSKNQKRRLWDKQNAAGERDRGWDWVDVVKHLSQTGSGAAPT